MHRCLLVTTVVIIQLAPCLSSYERRHHNPFALPPRPRDLIDDYPRPPNRFLDLLQFFPEIEDHPADHGSFSKIVRETEDGRLQFDFQKINGAKKKGGEDEEDDDDEEDVFRNPGAKRKATRSPTNSGSQRHFTNYEFKRPAEGPSLSIVNPLDVLRQRMMLEMARRRMKESQVQIAANAEYLDKLGKRSVDSQMLPFYRLSYHRPNRNTQPLDDNQESWESSSK